MNAKRPVSEAEREGFAAFLLRMRASGLDDKPLMAAIESVPRRDFVDATYASIAMGTGTIPIACGETIEGIDLQARIIHQMGLDGTQRVLEIGTGSGYQAAVLSQLVDHVYTIEIIESLAHQAQATLQRLHYRNVSTRIGDGYHGWKEQAPFDAIIVTCAPENVPAPLIDQLKEGGRLIIPVGQTHGNQELVLLEKKEGAIVRRAVLPVRFVPMTGEAQPD